MLQLIQDFNLGGLDAFQWLLVVSMVVFVSALSVKVMESKLPDDPGAPPVEDFELYGRLAKQHGVKFENLVDIKRDTDKIKWIKKHAKCDMSTANKLLRVHEYQVPA